LKFCIVLPGTKSVLQRIKTNKEILQIALVSKASHFTTKFLALVSSVLPFSLVLSPVSFQLDLLLLLLTDKVKNSTIPSLIIAEIGYKIIRPTRHYYPANQTVRCNYDTSAKFCLRRQFIQLGSLYLQLTSLFNLQMQKLIFDWVSIDP